MPIVAKSEPQVQGTTSQGRYPDQEKSYSSNHIFFIVSPDARAKDHPLPTSSFQRILLIWFFFEIHYVSLMVTHAIKKVSGQWYSNIYSCTEIFRLPSIPREEGCFPSSLEVTTIDAPKKRITATTANPIKIFFVSLYDATRLA